MFRSLISTLFFTALSVRQIVALPTPQATGAAVNVNTASSNNGDPTLLNYPYKAPWQGLPATPTLQNIQQSGYVSVSGGAKIWYGLEGASLSSTQSAGKNVVLFLHGGFANSNYFANQVSVLGQLGYTCLSIDSRGHGRSIDGTVPITYDLMTLDVIAVLNYLKIQTVAVIGWSDGAIIGYDMAMNFTSRIDRLFSYGGTYSPNNINATYATSPSFGPYLNRVEGEYKALNPYPNHWNAFSDKMNTMWSTQPTWDGRAFAKIPTLYNSQDAPLIWVVDGEQEDAVDRDVPRTLETWVPGSMLVLLPAVSHFGFLQDPQTFTGAVIRFLQYH